MGLLGVQFDAVLVTLGLISIPAILTAVMISHEGVYTSGIDVVESSEADGKVYPVVHCASLICRISELGSKYLSKKAVKLLPLLSFPCKYQWSK